LLARSWLRSPHRPSSSAAPYGSDRHANVVVSGAAPPLSDTVVDFHCGRVNSTIRSWSGGPRSRAAPRLGVAGATPRDLIAVERRGLAIQQNDVQLACRHRCHMPRSLVPCSIGEGGSDRNCAQAPIDARGGDTELVRAFDCEPCRRGRASLRP
jgi:hypothetical protein